MRGIAKIRKATRATVLLINDGSCATRGFWDIISALRGCDTGDVTLKDLTTARARAVIGIDCAYLTTTCRPLTPSERGLRDRLLKDSPHHFRTHWHRVVETIARVYRYDLRTEKPIGKRCYVPKALR